MPPVNANQDITLRPQLPTFEEQSNAIIQQLSNITYSTKRRSGTTDGNGNPTKQHSADNEANHVVVTSNYSSNLSNTSRTKLRKLLNISPMLNSTTEIRDKSPAQKIEWN
uniref:Uncharacterized protein n=1 Tax=Caenorhabditis japonica TaxID=281687 RepID=A0A8R1EAU9_CAEJA